MTTCREAVLRAAELVTAEKGTDTFTVPDIVGELKRQGSPFAEPTIRTHVTSRMCANAPDHHAVVYQDLERVGHGTYRLIGD